MLATHQEAKQSCEGVRGGSEEAPGDLRPQPPQQEPLHGDSPTEPASCLGNLVERILAAGACDATASQVASCGDLVSGANTPQEPAESVALDYAKSAGAVHHDKILLHMRRMPVACHTVNWWVAFPKQQARRAWHRPSHRLSRNVRAKSSAGSSVGAPSCSSTPRAYSQCPSCCSAFVRHGFFTDGSAPTTRHIGRCVLHSAPQEGLNVAAEWA
ncbi:Tbingi protein, partial [Trypanosoma rangeli]